MGPIQMHTEAKLDLTVKKSNDNVRPSLDYPSPMICAKTQPQGILCSGEGFLKVFTIYGHGGHLGQWTKTILEIFHFPAQ